MTSCLFMFPIAAWFKNTCYSLAFNSVRNLEFYSIIVLLVPRSDQLLPF